MPIPERGVAYDFYIPLVDAVDDSLLLINPTIVAGDFQISEDGSTFVNLETLPVVMPSNNSSVKISLSAGEMNTPRVFIRAKDVSGTQWIDVVIFIGVPEDNSIQSMPEAGEPFTFYISLVDVLNPTTFLLNPTIEAGDFKISQDGGNFFDLDPSPTVTPPGGGSVKVALSSSDMDADKIYIKAVDASGNEWESVTIFIDSIVVIVRNGGDSWGPRRRKEREEREEFDKLLRREDDEILSIIIAISRKNHANTSNVY